MKIKPTFKVREIAGECLIVNQGTFEVNMTKIISLNSSAKMLWESFCDMDFTVEQVAEKLVEVYGIDTDTAQTDASKWVAMLNEQNILE